MPNNGEKRDFRTSAINRRNVLLGGTTLTAVSTMTPSGTVRIAQAGLLKNLGYATGQFGKNHERLR
jgi:arylsulfatase A-like enzyme